MGLLGKRNHVISRTTPLVWRGGPGPGPCWNRSPNLAARNGDWKLLLNPDYAAPASQTQKFPRVELYNVSIDNLGLNGAFFEAQNVAEAHPDVVKSLAAIARMAQRSWPTTSRSDRLAHVQS